MDSITAGAILCIYLLIHFHLSNLHSLCIGCWMKLPSLNARCNDSSALPPRVIQAKQNAATLGPGDCPVGCDSTVEPILFNPQNPTRWARYYLWFADVENKAQSGGR